MKKYAHWLQSIAMHRLKQYKGKWIPAKETRNLPRIHEKYKQKIPLFNTGISNIGMTSLSFCKWEKPAVKHHEETPYTERGRQLYFRRTKKKRQNARLDHMYSSSTAQLVAQDDGKGTSTSSSI